MANFTTAGRLKNLGEIQKTYNWELYIPSIEDLDQDDMVIRVRNTVIPGRSITPIESHFMGTKSWHAGKTEYTGTFNVQMEEFEDQKVFTALHSWQQAIFDYSPDSPTAGQSKVQDKNGYTRDIVLRMYKNNGVKMEKEIVYFNAWPTSVSDVSLDYTASDSVKYECTFQYDYFLPR